MSLLTILFIFPIYDTTFYLFSKLLSIESTNLYIIDEFTIDTLLRFIFGLNGHSLIYFYTLRRTFYYNLLFCRLWLCNSLYYTLELLRETRFDRFYANYFDLCNIYGWKVYYSNIYDISFCSAFICWRDILFRFINPKMFFIYVSYVGFSVHYIFWLNVPILKHTKG